MVLLLADPAAAYLRSSTEGGDPLEWGRRCIPYHLHADGSADLRLSHVIEAVQQSFQAWEAVECGGLEFHYQGVTNDDRVGYNPNRSNINLVVFRDDPDDWPHADGVIALTTATFCTDPGNADCPAGRVIDADIELNGAHFDFTTTTNPRLVEFDLRNTLTHEVGHFVGLDHTPVQDATMFASAPAGERKKASLHNDDREGLCAIYPAGGGGACETFEIEGDHFVDPGELAIPAEEGGCRSTAAPGPWWLLLLLAAAPARIRGGGKYRS